MPLYFFRIEGREPAEGGEGVVLPDDAAAYVQAARELADTLQRCARSVAAGDVVSLLVTDENNRLVALLRLSTVLSVLD